MARGRLYLPLVSSVVFLLAVTVPGARMERASSLAAFQAGFHLPCKPRGLSLCRKTDRRYDLILRVVHGRWVTDGGDQVWENSVASSRCSWGRQVAFATQHAIVRAG
eukprot:3842758-Rhodomonas_salina.1